MTKRRVFSFRGLLAALLILHLIAQVQLWGHTSATTEVFGRFSPRYAGGIAAHALVTAAFALAIWQARRLESRLRPLSTRTRITISALMLFGLSAVWLLPIDGELKHAVALTAATLGVIVWHAVDLPASPRTERRVVMGVALLCVLSTALILLTILSEFRFSPDEAHWADFASTAIQYGGVYARTWLAEPYRIMPGLGWSVAGYGWVLENVAFDIRTGRLWTFGFYLIMLVGLWKVTAHLYGRLAAAFSVFFATACSAFFPFYDYRPHYQIGAAGVWLAYCVLRVSAPNATQRWLWALLAGLTSALSMQLHAIGIGLVTGTSLYFAGDLIGGLWRERRLRGHVIAFGAGALFGTAAYLIFNVASVGGLSVYLADLVTTRTERRLPFWGISWPTILESVIVYGAFVLILWRRSTSDVRYLRWLLPTALAIVVLDTQGYRTPTAALSSIVVGALMTFDPAHSMRRLALGALLITTLLTTTLGMTYWPGAEQILRSGRLPVYSYTQLRPLLTPYVQPDDVVISTHLLIWTLPHQRHLYSTAAEVNAMRRWALEDPQQVWTRLNPTVVVAIPTQMEMKPSLLSYMQAEAFTLCSAFTVDELPVEIYRRDCPAS